MQLLRDLAPTIAALVLAALVSLAWIAYEEHQKKEFQEAHKHELIIGGP